MRKWLAGTVAAIVAGVIVWWITRPGGYINPPPPLPPPEIHSKGTKTFRFDGVRIGPQQANVTGPYRFLSIDLDQGQEASGDQVDVELQVRPRKGIVSFVADHAVDVGTSPLSYQECKASLSNQEGDVTVESKQPPTDYVCLETDEGRVSLFRILSASRSETSTTDIFNVSIQYEYKTWKWE